MTQTLYLDLNFISRRDAYYPFYKNYPSTEVAFLCIASMGKKKSGVMSILHHSKLLYTLPFLQESNGVKHHPISPINTKASLIMFPADTGLSETVLGPG